MATKRKSDLASELESARRKRLETITFRCDSETKELLDQLVAASNARGVGEIIRLAVRRLAKQAKEEGLLK